MNKIRNEFGYIDIDSIRSEISNIDSVEEKASLLKNYLQKNIVAITKAKSFSEKVKNNSLNSDSVSIENHIDNPINMMEDASKQIDVDYYYNMIMNCQSGDLDDLLLNVIIPDDVLYPVLSRLQKEYVSYYNMYEEYKQEGDSASCFDCQMEMYNIITIIDHIKSFGQINDEDLDNLKDSSSPVNNLIYLTIGDKNLPYEDIKKIPLEYYSGISKLLTGMCYGKFNRIKSLYDKNLFQVSDGLRIRIYFQHIKDNNFLIAGIYLYTSNGKDKSSKIFIDKRDALSQDFIVKYNNENMYDDHAKVLQLLDNRGGH